MRILQLPSWYLPEGGQFCLHQSKALQEAGVEVHILANVVLPLSRYKFSVLKYPFRAFFCNENGIPMLRYYSWRIPRLDKLNIAKWVKETVHLYAMYEKKYGKPDLIHVHSSIWGGYAASIIKQQYSIPYVITEHRGIFGAQSAYARSLLKDDYSFLYKSAFGNADFIIPVSSQLIPKIKEYCAEIPVPIKVIPNVLDTDFFSYKQRARTDRDSFVFVAVNGFSTYKGYEYLLPAFDILCEKNPNVYLRLVGENFEFLEFQQLLKQVKHVDRISFSGELDRNGVREELYKADAFVIPSIVEAQSVATIEAMSTGIPVVSTIVNPEEILTDRCGYRVPIEDVNALENAMDQMIKNYYSFDGKYISEHTKSLVNKEAVISQIIDVYNQIIHP